MKRPTTFLLFAFLFLTTTQGQNGSLFLENPSFELKSPISIVNGELPDGYVDCGFPANQLDEKKRQVRFFTHHPPSHGQTCLGLSVNDDFTWERTSVRLSAPMQAEQRYVFHIDLSRTKNRVSPNRKTGEAIDFEKACKLRIWAGNSACDRKELLTESGPVSHDYWQDYAFVLSPTEPHTHLTFEAFYETSFGYPYNGKILIDNASVLLPIPNEGGEVPQRGEVLARQFEFVDTIFGEATAVTFFAKNDSMAAEISTAVFERGKEIEQALKKGKNTMKEAEWSRFEPNKDFREILLFALSANQDTKGFFDVGRQVELKLLWEGTMLQVGRAPSGSEIRARLENTGLRKIGVRSDSIFWTKNPEARFDWDGLARAHAIDEMAEKLVTEGCLIHTVSSKGIVSAKMEVLAYDRPFFEKGTVQMEGLDLNHSSIVSSIAGDFLLEYDGQRYYDFITPKKARPVTERRLVTVEATDCKTAYVWSQAFLASQGTELATESEPHILRKWISEK